MVDTKLLIGYTTAEYARRADFYDYLFMVEKPANSVILPCHDASPAKARNMLAQAAIDTNCTHLLIIDDDMEFRGDVIKRLIEHDKEIITGLYLQRSWPHRPLTFDFVEEDGSALYSYLESDKTGLQEIANCGLGFCLIKTDVFKQMAKPWFRLGEYDPQEWSDDIGFFNRATKVGFKIYVDLDIMIGHIGTVIIRPEYDKDEKKWYTSYNTDGKTSVRIPQNVPVGEYKFVGAANDSK